MSDLIIDYDLWNKVANSTGLPGVCVCVTLVTLLSRATWLRSAPV